MLHRGSVSGFVALSKKARATVSAAKAAAKWRPGSARFDRRREDKQGKRSAGAERSKDFFSILLVSAPDDMVPTKDRDRLRHGAGVSLRYGTPVQLRKGPRKIIN